MFDFDRQDQADQLPQTENVEAARQFTRRLPRILQFLNLTWQDVVQDAEARRQVFRLYRVSRDISDHLDRKPRRTAAASGRVLHAGAAQ